MGSAKFEVRIHQAGQFLWPSFDILHSSLDRPATIVGIPPMEDFYIVGAALTRPAATLSHRMGGAGGEGLNFPEIVDLALWGAHAPSRVGFDAPSKPSSRDARFGQRGR